MDHAQRGEERTNVLSTTKRSAELATSGAASAAKAKIEAAYTVALARPRDLDTVRVRLLEACRRPGFAEQAMYAKPVGQEKIRGLSVRFAEEAARLLGNLQAEDQTIYDDVTQRIVQVSVIDLETNYVTGKQVVIDKTVERKSSKGRVVLDERTNSYGDRVYVVLATEDELANKQAAAVAKAKRNLLIEMIPGDITSEARAAIKATVDGQIAADPAAARKAVADGFARLGIRPDALAAYLGHQLEQSSPREIADLRDVWSALNQGETTWAEILSGREAADEDRPAPAKSREVPQAETPPADTQAETTAEAPAETPPADPAPDLGAEIAAAVRALGGQTKAAAVLKPIASSFGVGKLSEIPQDRINEAITAIRAAVEGAKS
jgi:hypothetical protein